MLTANRQQNSQSTQKKRFFLQNHQTEVIFSSDFDSGNARIVRQLSELCYRLECIDDCSSTAKAANSRSWFYFSVSGFPKKRKGKFIVAKVQALISLYYSKYSRYYRPVFRVNEGQWERLPLETQINLTQSGEVQCTIEHFFEENQNKVQFAFCYPYTFQQQEAYLRSLQPFQLDQEIYFHSELLVESPEKRPIHLLTITNRSNISKDQESQERFDNLLFPQNKRPYRLKKPVVLMAARVHPGQTPSSYAMEGAINFLLSKEDLRAQMLREMFVFMIVPMINVDGVFHGHFRMDIHGKNLNRFYINPNPILQPAIYAIKELAKHLISSNRLSFYFDFHGHNAKKGCFIYGNAFSEFVEQVQSQIFCKLFAMNHSGFEYEYCNFSQKHMNAKDRFQDLTKEGCGRVVMHKEANIIHSYSLQCGIISANTCNAIPEASNKDFKVKQKGFVRQSIEEPNYQGIKMPDNSVLFDQQSYKNLGKNLLVSILDVFDKNPYSRVYNSRYKSMEALRRITAFEIFHSTDRFRMFEKSLFGKVKNINSLVSDILSTKTQYKQLYNCYFTENECLNQVEWPKSIVGLIKPKATETANKFKKFKSIYEVKSSPIIEEQSPKRQSAMVKAFQQKQKVLSQLSYLEKLDIKIDRTQTIMMGNKSGLPAQQDDNVGQVELKDQLDIHKPSSSVFIMGVPEDQEDENDNHSDGSEVRQNELNQEILLMCADQNEEKEVLSRIMQNNFDEKDYQQIEEKYKYKNLNEEQAQELDEQLCSTPKQINCAESNSSIRNLKSSKQPKYRLNRKIIINTCDVATKYKKNEVMTPSESTKKESDAKQQLNSHKRITAAEEFRRNIYDAIKQEIKEGLRRQYDRRKQRQRVDNKLIDSFRMKQNGRVRSNNNYNDLKKMKSKVRLPSLGSNMYILTTSTKIIQKN